MPRYGQRCRDQYVWTFILVNSFVIRVVNLFRRNHHLKLPFCSWPCLHQWLETRPNKKVCPVCKSGINKDKVIPLYGRGSTNQEDPRYV